MKSLLLFAILAVATATPNRVKRGISDCTEAVSSCTDRLDSRLGLNSKVQDTLKQDTPSTFECCYLAEYNNCLESTKEECTSIGSSILSGVTGAASKLTPGCAGDEYSYPSAKCIFFVWFYWIVGAIIALVLLSLICCVARCICGRN